MSTERAAFQLLFDHLDIGAGLRLLLFALRHPVAEVRFRAATRPGRAILAACRVLRRCPGATRLEIDFAAALPEGGGLWYWVQAAVEDVGAGMASAFAQQRTFLDLVSPRIERPRQVTFLRVTIGQQVYWPMALALSAQRDRTPGLQPVVFASLGGLMPTFTSAAHRWAPDVTFVDFVDWRNSWPIRLGWFLLLQARLVLRGLAGLARGRRAKPHATIGIQHAWGLDQGGHQKDLWWMEASGIDAARFLVLFPHRSTLSAAAVERSRRRLDEMGVRHYDLGRAPSVGSGKVCVAVAWRALADLARVAAAPAWLARMRAPFWQFGMWLRVCVQVRYWQALMEAENLRVFFDVTETSFDAAALAADIVGAVKMHVFPAPYVLPISRSSPLHQVQLIWGPAFLDVFQQIGAAPSLTLEAGKADRAGSPREEWSEASRRHRAQLLASGAKHVVAVLDRSAEADSLCPPPYHVRFYGAMLAWAEADPTIALLVKPKSNAGVAAVRYAPEIGLRFDALADAGRLLVLPGEQTPEEAALASDVVVALGLNSAGLQTAIEGVRTVHWDPTGALEGPYAQLFSRMGWKEGTVVFEEMDELVASVKQFFRDPESCPGLGDPTALAAGFDPFGDGRADLRVAASVRWLLEAYDAGIDRPAALRQLADRYAVEWGADKVRWPSEEAG